MKTALLSVHSLGLPVRSVIRHGPAAILTVGIVLPFILRLAAAERTADPGPAVPYAAGATVFLTEELSAAASAAAVVGRHVFYNNSAWDNNNPAANTADDAAIAPDKVPLRGGEVATFANYTSYSRGINGVIVDISSMPGAVTANDFSFKVGNDNSPADWDPAPAPVSVTIRAGAGLNGSDRVTLIWPDNAIQKQWLQITTLATLNTGLASPDVFYFGNAIGECHNASDALVTVEDEALTRAYPRTVFWPAQIDFPYDFNRDKKVNPGDQLIARAHVTTIENGLNLISASRVVGRFTFYNQSAFDGNGAAAHANDDGAIAPDKTALLPGETATFANYTSYSRGINGLLIDIAGMGGAVAPADFEFRVGNDNNLAGWIVAPPPTSITVRPGAGVGGADRVTVIWANNAIQKQWLQVIILPTTSTGLVDVDVFYFGNAIGETGNSLTDAQVMDADIALIRQNSRSVFDPAPIDFPYDIDRDGRVNPADQLIARGNKTTSADALNLISAP